MPSEKLSEADKFWKEREEAYGGSLEFQSYAVLLGESGSGKTNGRGGLCFVIGGRFYFEDFEKQNAMMALFGRKDKDYEKTEISFPLDSLKGLKKISEKWARQSVSEVLNEELIPELKGIFAIFSRGFWLVQLEDRPSLVMEIMDIEKFRKFTGR